MEDDECKLSYKIIDTVAEALDKDLTELPPLEKTISAEALERLYHSDNPPPGAHTVFPYCGLWVVAYSTGKVDVFDNYRATSAEKQLQDDISKTTSDTRMVVLHFRGERYLFDEPHLDTFQEILAEADGGDEAWANAVQYARQMADD